MANQVTDKCLGCGACISECPNGAISEVAGATGKTRCEIDPTLCDECADNGGKPACMAVCAEDAIVKM